MPAGAEFCTGSQSKRAAAGIALVDARLSDLNPSLDSKPIDGFAPSHELYLSVHVS